MFNWLASDDPVEDSHLCQDHAIMTEMLFTEVLAIGDQLTVFETTDIDGNPFLVMEDGKGQMWYFGKAEQLTWVDRGERPDDGPSRVRLKG